MRTKTAYQLALAKIERAPAVVAAKKRLRAAQQRARRAMQRYKRLC